MHYGFFYFHLLKSIISPPFNTPQTLQFFSWLTKHNTNLVLILALRILYIKLNLKSFLINKTNEKINFTPDPYYCIIYNR